MLYRELVWHQDCRADPQVLERPSCHGVADTQVRPIGEDAVEHAALTTAANGGCRYRAVVVIVSSGLSQRACPTIALRRLTRSTSSAIDSGVKR